MPDVHVVPSGDRWTCENRGNQAVDPRHTAGKPFGRDDSSQKSRTSELVIHAEDGSIREKDAHGNDPRDIPG